MFTRHRRRHRPALRLPALHGAADLCQPGEAGFPLCRGGFDLYATRWHVLRRIIVPLSKPGIVAGCLLVFIPALGAYVTPLLVGGGKQLMIGNLIALQFGRLAQLAVRLGGIADPDGSGHGRAAVSMCATGRANRGWPMAEMALRAPAAGFPPAQISTSSGSTGSAPPPLLCLVLLYAPILILFAFSFNGTRSVTVWTGFSLDWYRQGIPERQDPGRGAQHDADRHLRDGDRHDHRHRGGAGDHAHKALARPDRQLHDHQPAADGAGDRHRHRHADLLRLLAAALGIRLGINQIMLAAHAVFCIPFAYMPIRARLEDMDLTLEQAAADLYATPWQTFRRVTLPLLMPGIIAGATLAFVVSFDDFTITSMLVGPGRDHACRSISGRRSAAASARRSTPCRRSCW